MDPPPSSATSPRPPIPVPKLRLMCSYSGHIVPRPHDKSLFYAGGETRIVAVDRRTTAASLSSLTAHLSRALFNNRPFHLKYQLPDEDLDSLISVITDEDLSIMIDEHDRVSPPARIRLFLFPVRAESLDSTLLDPKSESWFSDALKNTGVLQKGQSADCGLFMDLEAQVESKSKIGAESVFLETSSSFGSTGSSFSMSNSPPIGVVNCEDKGSDFLDRKIRVPSSASIESENIVGSLAAAPKAVISQEPLIQVALEAPLFHIESKNIPSQKTVQVPGYPLSHPPDGNNPQYQTQLSQGGLQYVPQYPPYYPVYQMPMHPQHNPGPPNQLYPVYLMPVRPTQYHDMPMQQFNSTIDTNTTSSSSRPPLHPQATSIPHQKDVFGTQIAESATTMLPSMPSNQSQLVVGTPEAQIPSEAIISEFEDDIAYNQIYKSQPSAPILRSHYQAVTKGTTVMLPEPSVQLHKNHAKQQAAMHTQQ